MPLSFSLCSGFVNLFQYLFAIPGPYRRGCHTLPWRNSGGKSTKCLISIDEFVPLYRHAPWRRSVEKKASPLVCKYYYTLGRIVILGAMMLLAISIALKSFIGRHYDFLTNVETCRQMALSWHHTSSPCAVIATFGSNGMILHLFKSYAVWCRRAFLKSITFNSIPLFPKFCFQVKTCSLALADVIHL